MKLQTLTILTLAAMAFAGEMKLGKPITVSQPMTPAAVIAQGPALSGKTVQVKGKVTEVCLMMGCWMMLQGEDGQGVRIRVNDGEIVFPKDAPGKTAVAEGTLMKIELTKEQAMARARHEAEEQGRTFDASKVKGGATLYEVRGTGAVIQDAQK